MAPLRQIRRGLSFLLRPLLYAVLLTVVVRFIFGGGKPKYTKALVVASTQAGAKELADWIAKIRKKEWTIHKYVVDAPESYAKRHNSLTVPVNKGGEAMAYLTYIIDNYDDLPDVIFFRKDKGKPWYQDLASDREVALLRPKYVIKHGFANARCPHECENVILLKGDPIKWKDFSSHGDDARISTMLKHFLGPGEEFPKKISTPSYAQFAASREAIQRRKKEWWIRLRQFLVDTPLSDKEAAKVLAHTWHIWLGQEAE